MQNNKIFITGGTGYIGSRLIPKLIEDKYEVKALVRQSSLSKLPGGCQSITGDALNSNSFKDKIAPCETFIHLIGVAHPGPAKAAQFQSIDLASIRASVEAAKAAGIKHFIYVSVAQGSGVMKAFQGVRAEGERLLRESGMKVTIIRPWYVLGPGHYWPIIMIPFLKLMEAIPSTREKALRIGIVTIKQMLNALVNAVRNPPDGVRIVEVEEMRKIEVVTSKKL
jgi:uncharacterized protein YbjT (DUF2867 family)